MLRSDNIQLECTYAYSDYAQSPLNDDRSLLAQHRIKGRLPQVRLLVQSDFQPAANLDYVWVDDFEHQEDETKVEGQVELSSDIRPIFKHANWMINRNLYDVHGKEDCVEK